MKLPALTRRSLLRLLGIAPIAVAAPAVAASRAPVRVLRTRVNGERYYEAADSVASLEVGDAVSLRREPDNDYDKRAIEVLDAAGRKLGYVARADNSAIARMIDAGERFAARVGRLDRETLDIRLEIDWLRA